MADTSNERINPEREVEEIADKCVQAALVNMRMAYNIFTNMFTTARGGTEAPWLKDRREFNIIYYRLSQMKTSEEYFSKLWQEIKEGKK